MNGDNSVVFPKVAMGVALVSFSVVNFSSRGKAHFSIASSFFQPVSQAESLERPWQVSLIEHLQLGRFGPF